LKGGGVESNAARKKNKGSAYWNKVQRDISGGSPHNGERRRIQGGRKKTYDFGVLKGKRVSWGEPIKLELSPDRKDRELTTQGSSEGERCQEKGRIRMGRTTKARSIKKNFFKRKGRNIWWVTPETNQKGKKGVGGCCGGGGGVWCGGGGTSTGKGRRGG